jgi:hypothetical protein
MYKRIAFSFTRRVKLCVTEDKWRLVQSYFFKMVGARPTPSNLELFPELELGTTNTNYEENIRYEFLLQKFDDARA